MNESAARAINATASIVGIDISRFIYRWVRGENDLFPGNTMNSLRVIPYTCHRDITEGGKKSLSRISRLNWRHCRHCRRAERIKAPSRLAITRHDSFFNLSRLALKL